MNKKAIVIISAFAAAVLAIILAVLLWPKNDAAKTVGICYRQGDSKENAAYREQLERSLAERGYTLISVDADEDQNKQLTQIRQLKDQGCDLLLLEPVMTDSVTDILKEANGCPMILINRQIDTGVLQGASQVYYIGNRESDIVAVQLEMMRSLPNGGDLNGDGTASCLLLSGAKDHIQSQRYEEAFAKQTDIQILGVENGEISLESGRKLCREKLAEYGKDIEVVFCIHDRMALGAVEAIHNGGRTVGKDVYLFGVGGEGITQVQAGDLSGTAFVDQNVQIRTICDTASALFAGQKVNAVQLLPYMSS